MAAERVTGPWLPRDSEMVSRGLDYLLDCARREENVRERQFDGLAAEGESLRLLAAAQCRFVNCSFQGCSFEQGSFVDVVFQSCDFSNCDFSASFF
ncbi:MAG: pentapeptide repeat-containing protein, partial [Clostridium sp.]|nr:pentapeptide repeat-containing protein [Clostridium sp.]